MTLKQKIGRTAVAVAMAKYILESEPETVVSGEKKKDEDENLESKKRDKAIAEWIGWPFKPPLHNEGEEYE